MRYFCVRIYIGIVLVQTSLGVNQYEVPLVLLNTDNYPTWISGMDRVVVEIIWRPNLYKRYVAGLRIEPATWTVHPTDLDVYQFYCIRERYFRNLTGARNCRFT